MRQLQQQFPVVNTKDKIKEERFFKLCMITVIYNVYQIKKV